jgi:hypothetical protein
MAQETVIHRIDAELGAGSGRADPRRPGRRRHRRAAQAFVAYGVAEWADYFADILAGSPGVRTRSGPTVRHGGCGPARDSSRSRTGAPAGRVTVSGSPRAVLRWVWNREIGPSGVTVEGAPEAVDELKRCITTATQ